MHEVLKHMNLHGRVVLCGLISGYTKEDPALESFATILRKRLRVQGFIILDYADRFMEGATQLGKWKMFGKLKNRETIVEGLRKRPTHQYAFHRSEYRQANRKDLICDAIRRGARTRRYEKLAMGRFSDQEADRCACALHQAA